MNNIISNPIILKSIIEINTTAAISIVLEKEISLSGEIINPEAQVNSILKVKEALMTYYPNQWGKNEAPDIQDLIAFIYDLPEIFDTIEEMRSYQVELSEEEELETEENYLLIIEACGQEEDPIAISISNDQEITIKRAIEEALEVKGIEILDTNFRIGGGSGHFNSSVISGDFSYQELANEETEEETEEEEESPTYKALFFKDSYQYKRIEELPIKEGDIINEVYFQFLLQTTLSTDPSGHWMTLTPTQEGEERRFKFDPKVGAFELKGASWYHVAPSNPLLVAFFKEVTQGYDKTLKVVLEASDKDLFRLYEIYYYQIFPTHYQTKPYTLDHVDLNEARHEISFCLGELGEEFIEYLEKNEARMSLKVLLENVASYNSSGEINL